MWWNSTLFCLRGVTQTKEIVNWEPKLLLLASPHIFHISPSAVCASTLSLQDVPFVVFSLIFDANSFPSDPDALPTQHTLRIRCVHCAGTPHGFSPKSFLKLICPDGIRNRAAQLISAGASGSNYACTKRKSPRLKYL